jgi:hypothetical protein
MTHRLLWCVMEHSYTNPHNLINSPNWKQIYLEASLMPDTVWDHVVVTTTYGMACKQFGQTQCSDQTIHPCVDYTTSPPLVVVDHRRLTTDAIDTALNLLTETFHLRDTKQLIKCGEPKRFTFTPML